MFSFQKKSTTRSQVCRTASNQSALERIDPGASIKGSNFEIRHFGADKMNFELIGLTLILQIIDIPTKNINVENVQTLIHQWMRQDQYFPAHFDSTPYDTHASVWYFFLKTEQKMKF